MLGQAPVDQVTNVGGSSKVVENMAEKQGQSFMIGAMPKFEWDVNMEKQDKEKEPNQSDTADSFPEMDTFRSDKDNSTCGDGLSSIIGGQDFASNNDNA